jgi:hypothetical protein
MTRKQNGIQIWKNVPIYISRLFHSISVQLSSSSMTFSSLPWV